MTFDPAWDMPQLNWQQQGCYEQGSVPPTVEPDAGTQVFLGPVAREWLPWICGALDQLRNPSAWIVADETAMYNTLRRVDTLLGLICGNGGTMNFITDVTFSACSFTLHFANGTSRAIVDWDGEFHNCIVANLPPPLPPNPGGRNPDQLACDISGFLAQVLIQETMQQIYRLVSAGKTKDFIVTGVAAAIGIFFPEIDGATIALSQFVDAVIAQALAEINFVATDPVFWSHVTCAIFSAIRAAGHLTVGNILTAGSNILAISYPGHVWAPPAVAAYWLALGYTNLLFAQSSGAVDVVDCSNCGTYCEQLNFDQSTNGWLIAPGFGGQTWTLGAGFVAAPGNRSPTLTELDIYRNFGATYLANPLQVMVAFTGGVVAGDFGFNAYTGGLGGTLVGTWHFSNASTGTGGQAVYTLTAPAPVSFDTLEFFLVIPSGTSAITLRSLQIGGPGANQFGANNCKY